MVYRFSPVFSQAYKINYFSTQNFEEKIIYPKKYAIIVREKTNRLITVIYTLSQE